MNKEPITSQGLKKLKEELEQTKQEPIDGDNNKTEEK